MNTQAIQKAIDTATSGQGGIVQIPKGFYLSGVFLFLFFFSLLFLLIYKNFRHWK